MPGLLKSISKFNRFAFKNQMISLQKNGISFQKEMTAFQHQPTSLNCFPFFTCGFSTELDNEFVIYIIFGGCTLAGCGRYRSSDFQSQTNSRVQVLRHAITWKYAKASTLSSKVLHCFVCAEAASSTFYIGAVQVQTSNSNFKLELRLSSVVRNFDFNFDFDLSLHPV